MPTYNRGPCCCGEILIDCCTSCPCPGMDIFIEIDGPAYSGNYIGVWEATPGQPWTHAWVFKLDGDDDCGEVQVRCRAEGGNIIFDMWRPDLMGVGADVSVICGVETPITIDNSCTWFSAPGNNTLVTITFNCAYPEYIELLTNIPNGTCDCSNLQGIEAPINCGSSTIFTSLVYGTFTGACAGPILYTYACTSFTMSMNDVAYDAGEVLFSEFISGNPITMTRTGIIGNPCNWPATIEVVGRNIGHWCA
jgi:hypothetical protein